MRVLRMLFVLGLGALVLRYRGYLLDTESQLLYGLVPVFLASFFLFEKPIRRFCWSDGLLLGFLGFFALSALFRQQPFGFFEFTTFFVGAIVYYTVRFLKLPSLRTKEVFVAFGAVFSSYGLLRFLMLPTDRLSGFFHGLEPYSSYPNAAALLLLAVLAFNVELCFSKQRFWKGLLLLNTTAFVLTFSRGAYLAAIFCGGLAALFFARELFKKQTLKKVTGLVLCGLLAVGFAFTLNFFKVDRIVVVERLSLQDDAGLASVNERMEFFKGAVEMTLDHPWLGVGPGGFEAYYPYYQDHWLTLADHPHNLILKLSSELGIPGALFFLGFLICVFGSTLSRKMEPSQKVLWLAALAVLAHNLLDYNVNFSVLSVLFFVLLALLQNTTSGSNPRRERLGFMALMLLCLAVSGLTIWQGARMVEAKTMEALYEEDPADEEVLEYVQNPPYLPFEMDHFDLEGRLALGLGETEALQSFLNRFGAYSDYHRWLYFQAQLDPAALDELLTANGENELEYYYLFYQARPFSEGDAVAVAQVIRIYTELLSANAHMTVLSENPHYAQKLCELYPEELAYECNVFGSIWSLEVYKFNEHYGTSLTPL